jgi:hypothetical protein
VTRARTAVDAAAPSADAGQSSMADPRGLLISQGEGKATTPLPIEEAVQCIASRWLGQTTGPILEALVGRHR